MKKLLAIGCFAAALAMGQSANAAPLALGAGGVAGDLILGQVFQTNDLAGGAAVRAAAGVNGILGLAAGGRSVSGEPEYQRAAGTGGITTPASSTGAINSGTIAQGAETLSFVLAQKWLYLVVSYDGPNEDAGAQVYYIGDLAAGTNIELYRYASTTGVPYVNRNLAPNTFYKMTHYDLLNPSKSVPDGGTTAALLGLAMMGLGFVRRFRN